MKTISHWIGGKPTSGTSTRTAPVYNPATGEQQAEVVLANPADVADAVRAASAAFAQVSQTSLSTRTKILFEFRNLVVAHLQDLAEIIVDQHGKVLSDARGLDRRRRRDDRDQRPDPGPDGLLLVRRVEGLDVRRQARARC